MTTRGIPEVPMLSKELLHPQVRDFLVQMRQQLIELRSVQAPLAAPTNFKATAQAFSVTVQWTRSTGADYFEVLWNSNPNLQGANVVDVGASAQWTDNVGQSAITRFYWVRARRFTGAKSLEVGALGATTLASNVGVAPPVPPPPSKIIVVDQRTGHAIPYSLAEGRGFRSVE